MRLGCLSDACIVARNCASHVSDVSAEVEPISTQLREFSPPGFPPFTKMDSCQHVSEEIIN